MKKFILFNLLLLIIFSIGCEQINNDSIDYFQENVIAENDISIIENTIELKNNATFCKCIRKGILRASQFDDIIMDRVGEIVKPNKWMV